jgi:hypothetical protein
MQRLHAQMQLGFIARRGVLLDDAALGGAVDEGERRGQQFGGRLGVLGSDGAPHGADLVAQAGLILPVVLGALFVLSHALERGKMIGHLETD